MFFYSTIYLPSVDRSRSPRYKPWLFGGEGSLFCANINAIPSPEPAEFGKVAILTVKMVEILAGHASTGWEYRTRPTWFNL